MLFEIFNDIVQNILNNLFSNNRFNSDKNKGGFPKLTQSTFEVIYGSFKTIIWFWLKHFEDILYIIKNKIK